MVFDQNRRGIMGLRLEFSKILLLNHTVIFNQHQVAEQLT